MGIFEKFKNGLSKARNTIFKNIKTIFSGKILDDDVLEELEEILIMSDMGVEVSHEILEELKNKYKTDNSYNDPLLLLRDILVENLQKDEVVNDFQQKPYVILIKLQLLLS